LDSVDVEAMSPTQVSRWTMYARYGFMELRIKEAVWRFESVYASIFVTMERDPGSESLYIDKSQESSRETP